MKNNKIKTRICLAMDSRVYICTSGNVDAADANTATLFLDSENDEVLSWKKDDDTQGEAASSGVQNRVYANEADAIVAGLGNGQFYVDAAGTVFVVLNA